MNTLHYILDPLCGWCYAVEPMVALAQRKLGDAFCFELHAGGLFPGGTLPHSKRQYIRDSDMRIAHLTGQKFGTRYLDELLSDPQTNYDSALPTAALLAALELQPDGGLRMLRAVQHAHYQNGFRVAELPVLIEIAESIGFAPESYGTALASKIGEPTQRHVSATREMMQRVGATGFPTFLLQSGVSEIKIEHQFYYQSPNGFVEAVLQASAQSEDSSAISVACL